MTVRRNASNLTAELSAEEAATLRAACELIQQMRRETRRGATSYDRNLVDVAAALRSVESLVGSIQDDGSLVLMADN